MGTNWSKLQQIRRVEATANKLGFDLSAGQDTWQRESGNLIYLTPLDDKLPHYSRGAEIHCGTIEDIDLWLKGIEWARNYDEMLKLSSEKKRLEREQVERNRQLMQMVKTGKKVEGSVGTHTISTYNQEDVEEIDYAIWVDPHIILEDDIPF